MADNEDKKNEETEASTEEQETEAENAEGENVEGAEGEGEEGEAKPKSKLKLILLIAIPLLIVIIVAVVLFVTPFGRNLIGMGEENPEVVEEEAAEPLKAGVYFDLPDLLVNIDSSKKNRNSFLKLSIYLEIEDDKAKVELENVRPKIVDTFQVYLRSLRLEDLRGSAGLQRLREELLLRANAVSGHVKVTNILFREMLIQ